MHCTSTYEDRIFTHWGFSELCPRYERNQNLHEIYTRESTGYNWLESAFPMRVRVHSKSRFRWFPCKLVFHRPNRVLGTSLYGLSFHFPVIESREIPLDCSLALEAASLYFLSASYWKSPRRFISIVPSTIATAITKVTSAIVSSFSFIYSTGPLP